MSRAHEVVLDVVQFNRGDEDAGITKSDLRELTRGRFLGAGANGGLFGGLYPWMRSEGHMRYLTEAAKRRIRQLTR